MKTISTASLSMLSLSLGLFVTNTWAGDQIIVPYRSVRSASMGGVRLTTGLYDENFYGNPARVTQNPIWRVQLPDAMVEVEKNTVNAVKDMTGSFSATKLGTYAGQNLHGRVQMTFPSVYIPHFFSDEWSFAIGLLTSIQADGSIRKSYSLDPQVIVDTGPAITLGRTFGENDEWAVGLTSHLSYRLSGGFQAGLIDLIKGISLSPDKNGGQGAHLEFDLGGLYDLPFEPADFQFTVGAAVNNLLGGKYDSVPLRVIQQNLGKPIPQPRSFGFGFSAYREHLGPFDGLVLAAEVQNIGNNRNGSFFRMLHLGGEIDWSIFIVRAGLFQGYAAGGLGIDLKILQLDFGTYADETSLNAGGYPNRMYAARVDFRI